MSPSASVPSPTQRGVQAYVDVFNVYNRANLRSYGYCPQVNNGMVRTIRLNGEELLPILPTIGFDGSSDRSEVRYGSVENVNASPYMPFG